MKVNIKIINFMVSEDLLIKMEHGILLECINSIKEMDLEKWLKLKKMGKLEEGNGQMVLLPKKLLKNSNLIFEFIYYIYIYMKKR